MMNIVARLAMVLIGLASLAESASSRIHLKMHEEELKRVFSVATPIDVPEYEVVRLQWPKLQRRSPNSASRLRLNAFGKDIDLWLHPTEGTLANYDTPVYVANTTRNRVSLHRITNAMDMAGKMLEDRRKRATLIVKRSVDGRDLISGNIGSEGWILRPLPNRFNEDSSSNVYDREAPSSHVIFHRNPDSSANRGHVGRPIEMNSRRNSSRRKRAAPNTIFPQIFVLADYDTLLLHGKVPQLLEYLLPFWNGVDMRYRNLEYPKVRLNIAGIIIAGDRTAFSYVTRHKVGKKMLDIVNTLADFGRFVRSSVRPAVPDAFDVAFTFSPFDMCRPTNLYCIPGTLGLAYNAGACTADSPEIDYGVAVVQDRGAFDGVQTTAHELGHLLGAHHDGDGESPCSNTTGNIMDAVLMLTEYSQDWSTCSLNALDNFFNSEASACLFNEPTVSAAPDRVLPGSIMSMDEQCQKLIGTNFCRAEWDPCVKLSCFWSRRGGTCIGVPMAAADGSKCGDNRICLHERCTDVGVVAY